jgi:transcriptional regulator with XRE-family HTH domain
MTKNKTAGETARDTKHQPQALNVINIDGTSYDCQPTHEAVYEALGVAHVGRVNSKLYIWMLEHETTIEQLAGYTGVEPLTVAGWLAGRTPQHKSRRALAKLTGILWLHENESELTPGVPEQAVQEPSSPDDEASSPATALSCEQRILLENIEGQLLSMLGSDGLEMSMLVAVEAERGREAADFIRQATDPLAAMETARVQLLQIVAALKAA